VEPRKRSIYVLHFPSVESSELGDLREALHAVSKRVLVRERQPGLQMNVDWALPATVAIVISSQSLTGFLRRLGGQGAETTTKVFFSVYRRIKGRSKWLRGGKVVSGPVISVALDDALPAQRAQMVFTFPAGMYEREFRTALSRVPAVVRRERRRGRVYFEPPGTPGVFGTRSVKFYYKRRNRRWKRVWPSWPDWDMHVYPW